MIWCGQRGGSLSLLMVWVSSVTSGARSLCWMGSISIAFKIWYFREALVASARLLTYGSEDLSVV